MDPIDSKLAYYQDKEEMSKLDYEEYVDSVRRINSDNNDNNNRLQINIEETSSQKV